MRYRRVIRRIQVGMRNGRLAGRLHRPLGGSTSYSGKGVRFDYAAWPNGFQVQDVRGASVGKPGI